MGFKGATGTVKIVDKASSPLKNISKSFLGMRKASDKSNRSMKKSHSTLDKMSKRLNRVNRSFSAGKRAMKGYGSGLSKVSAVSSVLLGGGLVTALNQQASSLDKLGKKAQNLNLPIAELQAMQEQAKHAGLSSDDMGASLTRFTKRLGVFQATGGGLMGGIIKKMAPALAISLKGAKTNKEAYELILKTYAKLPTQQAKMALADAAFGMTGRKSLIMLDEGVEGLIAARKRLNELGGGASKEDVQAAADYNDAMQDIQFAVNGIRFKALTPILQEVTGLMLKFTEKFKNADYRTELIEKVKTTVKGVFGAIKTGIGVLQFLGTNLNKVIAGVLLFKVGMFALNAVMAANPIGLIVAGVAALVIGIGFAYTEFEGFRNFVDATGTFLLGVFKTVAKGFNDLFSNIGSGIDRVVSAFKTILGFVMKISAFGIGTIAEGASSLFGGGTTAASTQPQAALQTIQNNSTTNVPVAVSVNIVDNKVQGIETSGSSKTDVFLNNGEQF